MQLFPRFLLAGLILGILFSLQPTGVGGQEALPAEGPAKPATAPPAAETPPADPNKPAAAEFSQKFGEWKELLKEMLEAYGGIPMDDEELEAAVKVVQGYLTQVEVANAVDTSAVYSGRVIHLEPQTD